MLVTSPQAGSGLTEKSINAGRAVVTRSFGPRFPPRWGAAWWTAFLVCKPVLLVVRRRDWRGLDNIPQEGGVVLAVNHVSELDPLLVAEAVLATGRTPAFLAKSSLFDSAIVGRWFRAAGHVQVDRDHGRGGFDAALEALRAGTLVVVYPEGSITKNNDGRLMGLKSGAVRLALESGAPLIPVAQLGAQQVLPAYSRRPRLLKRPVVTIDVGQPLGLDNLRRRGSGPEVVQIGTRRLTNILTTMIEDLVRGRRPV